MLSYTVGRFSAGWLAGWELSECIASPLPYPFSHPLHRSFRLYPPSLPAADDLGKESHAAFHHHLVFLGEMDGESREDLRRPVYCGNPPFHPAKLLASRGRIGWEAGK